MRIGINVFVREAKSLLPDGPEADDQDYMAVISQLHQSEMKDLLMGFIGTINSAAGDPNEACMSSNLSRFLDGYITLTDSIYCCSQGGCAQAVRSAEVQGGYWDQGQ
jgi:hypothetical protein